MVISTRILHEQEEFLVQDKNASNVSRVITLLARPQSPVCQKADPDLELKRIRTNHGDWIPVAMWNKTNGLAVLMEEAGAISAVLQTILDKYMAANNQLNKHVKRKRYFYHEREGRLGFSMAQSHPYGLAVNLFSSRKGALEETEEFPGTRIKQTDDLKDFLTKAADDGYAGAILDDRDPIYFCLDPAEQMVFLKLCVDAKADENVKEHLLNAAGTWDDYDGSQEIEFFLDQDRCDKNMVDHLGDIPFFGHHQIESVWTIEDQNAPDAPYRLQGKDNPFQHIANGGVVVLFHDNQNALDYIMDRGLYQCEVVRVDDLRSFLGKAQKREWSVVLEPFNHRAASGLLWLNHHEIVLDSFSGFWILGEHWNFTHA